MSKPKKIDLSKVSTSDLIDEIRNRKETIALVHWTKEDIRSQCAENFDFTQEECDAITDEIVKRNYIQNSLEDCSDGWNHIDDAISTVADDLGIKHP